MIYLAHMYLHTNTHVYGTWCCVCLCVLHVGVHTHRTHVLIPEQQAVGEWT